MILISKETGIVEGSGDPDSAEATGALEASAYLLLKQNARAAAAARMIDALALSLGAEFRRLPKELRYPALRKFRANLEGRTVKGPVLVPREYPERERELYLAEYRLASTDLLDAAIGRVVAMFEALTPERVAPRSRSKRPSK